MTFLSGHAPSLHDMQQKYLRVRQCTLRIAKMDFNEALKTQARYVQGEACELQNAAWDLLSDCTDEQTEIAGQHLRHEIADVVLATVTLANLFGWSVEDCIAEKTQADRGRG